MNIIEVGSKVYKKLKYNKRELVEKLYLAFIDGIERIYLTSINPIGPLRDKMDIRIQSHHELDGSTKLAINKAYERVFSPAAREYMNNTAKPKWFVLGLIGKRLVSYCYIVEPKILFDDKAIKAGGIGGVLAIPSHRGFGLTSEVFKQAQKFIFSELNVDCGLLLCHKPLTSFYKRFDWHEPDSILYYNADGTTTTYENAVMLRSYHKKYQPGIITVKGVAW